MREMQGTTSEVLVMPRASLPFNLSTQTHGLDAVAGLSAWMATGATSVALMAAIAEEAGRV